MILELKNIKLSFVGNGNEMLNLLKGVSFGIEKGSITALIGGNGSGKTTLFNIISGFEKNYSGEVWFDGKNISKLAPHKISIQGIGRLFQSNQLIDDMSILDNMKLAAENRTGEFPFTKLFFPGKVAIAEKSKEERAIEILKNLFGEDNKFLGMFDKKSNSLSYGEQRLIALARLMMNNDKFLMLDEPSAGINPHYFESVIKVIRRMVELSGVTILLIEHNLDFIRKLAERSMFLNEGVIQMTGATEEVLSHPNLNSYMGL